MTTRVFGALAYVVAITLVAVPAQQADAQSTPPQPTEGAQTNPNLRAKSPALVAQIILPAATSMLGNLAYRFFNWLGEKIATSAVSAVENKPTSLSASTVSQANLPANAGQMLRAVYIPPAPAIPQNVKAATGIIYGLDRLAPDYSLIETITPQAGVSPTFQSREKFAIRYMSNAPGVVVIINVDSLQKTSYLGTFVIQPGVEMRFPQAGNKAMVLDDTIGLEAYQMFFMACLPSQFANMPDVIARRGQIPECGSTVQVEQAIQLAMNSRRAKGTFSEALMESDGSSKAVLSMAPYEFGDITATTFTINHVAPTVRQEAPQLPQTPQSAQPASSGQI